MRVLHIIPEFVFSNTFHGAYKDVLFRTQWIERNSPEHRQLCVQQDDPEEVKQVLVEFHPTHVLIEYTRFPKIIRAIRSALPDVWLGVRAHNIEPLQHLDNHGWWPARGPLWLLYGMFRLWMQDVAAKRMADSVLSINEWENRIYWNRLSGKAQVEWLPYVCPEHLLPANPMPVEERNIIACLPTSKENRKSRDQVLRFQQLAREMKRQGCKYKFVLTGDLSKWNLPDCPEVTLIGFVEDLSEFMGRCRAVCMLSPLGYGFKTTIADALASGAHMLAHPNLVRRCPEAVRPQLLSVDTCHMPDLRAVFTALEVDPRGTAIHQELYIRAEQVIKFQIGESIK